MQLAYWRKEHLPIIPEKTATRGPKPPMASQMWSGNLTWYNNCGYYERSIYKLQLQLQYLINNTSEESFNCLGCSRFYPSTVVFVKQFKARYHQIQFS